jgi:hypothetical protein
LPEVILLATRLMDGGGRMGKTLRGGRPVLTARQITVSRHGLRLVF